MFCSHPTRSVLCLAGVTALLLINPGFAEVSTQPPSFTAPNEASVLLNDLEARAPKDWKSLSLFPEFNAEIVRLVGSNLLKSGSDYLRVAKLLEMDLGSYRTIRVRYESLLTAVAKGEPDAESGLPLSWDFLLHSLGRPLRIDTVGNSAANPEFFELDPAPDCIQALLRDPTGARAQVTLAADNPEILALRDADQAIRQADWSKRTDEQRKADRASDLQRLARMREIIAAGELRTAADFARAALVMQHSARFAGFQLAHELAVCSLLLGDRQTGRWLVAATYDRMLGSLGHDQRFGTQYGPGGLQPMDETGICDTQRLALGCPTLADARNRNNQLPPRLSDQNYTVNDPVNKVSATYPAGWKLVRSSVVGAKATSIRFSHLDYPKITLNLYYRMEAFPPVPAGPEATLRQQAVAKELDRRESLPDYRNVPESFRYREVADRPILSWIARYAQDGQPLEELLIRIAGQSSNALIFLQAPRETVEALRPSVEAMADTVQVP